jgi:hypothetical protein
VRWLLLALVIVVGCRSRSPGGESSRPGVPVGPAGNATSPRDAPPRREGPKEESTHPVRAAAKPVPGAQGGAALRAGGLRVESYRSETYYVLYDADPALEIAGLTAALGTRRLGARVESFAQSDSPGSVQRGGEIVALAVAKQLQVMGWLVALARPETMLKGAPLPEHDKEATALAELQVSGRVRFATAARGAATVSELRGTITFARTDGETVFRRELAAEAKVLESEAPAFSQRAERATRDALKSFVRALCGHRDLATALIAFVKRAPKG